MAASLVEKQVSTALKGHLINLGIRRDVKKIAVQIAGEEKELGAAAILQLVDLAECEQRLLDARTIAFDLKASDQEAWLKVVSKIQSDTGLKRALFKDLFAASTQNIPAKTASPGKGWAGTV